MSIPTALQRLFYDLKTSYTAVRTTELTRSFGWDTRQTWIQQDVQEFCCLLLDALDAKTKGIKGVEHEINKLFEVKHRWRRIGLLIRVLGQIDKLY